MEDASLVLPTGEVVWFDAADAPLIKQYRWHRMKGGPRSKTVYADTKIRGRNVSMHRLLMGEPTSTVDHIDRNGLNNRRLNLRLATYSQQRGNSCVQKKRAAVHSKYKGVIWYHRNANGAGPGRAGYGRWMARISLPGGVQDSRYAASEDDAALIYNFLALKHFGEFARLNEC